MLLEEFKQLRIEKLKRVLIPASLPCFDFTDGDGNRHKRTVIIAPITIEEKSRILRISYACSRSLYCHDGDCRYSRESLKNKHGSFITTKTSYE